MGRVGDAVMPVGGSTSGEFGCGRTPALLLMDGTPARGNVRALEVLLAQRVQLVTFPPHLTYVLQPVGVSWARTFKAEFAGRFRVWTSEGLNAHLRRRLHPTRGVSAVMMRQGQAVAAT